MMKLKYFIKDILNFLREKDFDVDPLPKIILDNSENEQDNLFIKTGYYDANNQRIVLFTNGRHMKDILRSFVHEIVHHHQYLTNRKQFLNANLSGKIEENPELRKIESEAFLLGNLYFRMYTERFNNPK